MAAFVTKRLALALLVAIFVSSISFSLMFLTGDPAIAIAGEGATEADIQVIRRTFGFDRPFIVQYWDWISGAAMGNFGQSYYFNQPVVDLLAERMPVTATLAAFSIAFALLLAIPLGILAAVKRNSLADRLSLALATVGQATPSFWLALMLIVLFAVTLRWLPVSGSSTLAHFILPSIVLGYYASPSMMRLTRGGMIEALRSDYIRTARAKGMLPRTIILKHALRNAILPVVSVAAVEFGFILGGSVVVESVFSLRGIGYLAWESIGRNDFPTIQAIILVYAMIYVCLTFLADVLNAWIDPRIRVA
ncbi:ABC transporter permease [Caenispirillum bisanense]|uniref:ABC transporter permease n=1 Tax=Caenispirillum bisanense TaxID=414052 RepID=UPI0031D3B211